MAETKRRAIRIDDDLWQGANAAAEAEHVSTGQWIRQLIRKALKRQ